MQATKELQDVGPNVHGAAKKLVPVVKEGQEKDAEWVQGHVEDPGGVRRAQNFADIREHMPVLASCGKRVGTVDRVQGESIKLTKDAPAAHGEHRYIPKEWVGKVDEIVHLTKNSEEVEHEWRDGPVQAHA